MGIQKGTGENQSVGRNLFLPLQTEAEVCFSRPPQIEWLFPLRLSIIQFFYLVYSTCCRITRPKKKRVRKYTTYIIASHSITGREQIQRRHQTISNISPATPGIL